MYLVECQRSSAACSTAKLMLFGCVEVGYTQVTDLKVRGHEVRSERFHSPFGDSTVERGLVQWPYVTFPYHSYKLTERGFALEESLH